jgi:hypothetical protein
MTENSGYVKKNSRLNLVYSVIGIAILVGLLLAVFENYNRYSDNAVHVPSTFRGVLVGLDHGEQFRAVVAPEADVTTALVTAEFVSFGCPTLPADPNNVIGPVSAEVAGCWRCIQDLLLGSVVQVDFTGEILLGEPVQIIVTGWRVLKGPNN